MPLTVKNLLRFRDSRPRIEAAIFYFQEAIHWYISWRESDSRGNHSYTFRDEKSELQIGRHYMHWVQFRPAARVKACTFEHAGNRRTAWRHTVPRRTEWHNNCVLKIWEEAVSYSTRGVGKTKYNRNNHLLSALICHLTSRERVQCNHILICKALSFLLLGIRILRSPNYIFTNY
jgi:hypothetical protein